LRRIEEGRERGNEEMAAGVEARAGGDGSS
jgi:hypothetical protein